MTTSNDILVISIEGNIGSGKSTLLNELRKKYLNQESDSIHVCFLKEPVDEWNEICDEYGVTMLENFYQNPNKYSFSFQIMAFISRLKVFGEALKHAQESNVNKKLVFITERSLYTDKMVFAQMLFDTGNMEYINHQVYLSCFNTFMEDFPIHKVVYVKTDADICHQRIMKRSRQGESTISLDYLKNCDNYHNAMLETFVQDSICSDQLVIDGNIDIFENENMIDKWSHDIDAFIHLHKAHNVL
jgi:deoxyadenosine/deoxycytidine kinase